MCTLNLYDVIRITRHLQVKLKSFSNLVQPLHKIAVRGCSFLHITAMKSEIMSEAFFVDVSILLTIGWLNECRKYFRMIQYLSFTLFSKYTCTCILLTHIIASGLRLPYLMHVNNNGADQPVHPCSLETCCMQHSNISTLLCSFSFSLSLPGTSNRFAIISGIAQLCYFSVNE